MTHHLLHIAHACPTSLAHHSSCGHGGVVVVNSIEDEHDQATRWQRQAHVIRHTLSLQPRDVVAKRIMGGAGSDRAL